MKTQVFIVTGFLGTGKTTLVKRILQFSGDLSKTIVLVNEFGKAGIDGALIKHTAAADIVELSSGCICCSLKMDMIQTLQMLRQEYSPERVVIEATGVADPSGIIEAMKDRKLSPHFSVNKTITVVDGEFWEAREAFGSVFTSQLTRADVLLLNKIDILDPSQISTVLEEIAEQAPKARIIPTLYCNIDPDIFWADIKETDRKTNTYFTPYDPQKDVTSFDKGTMAAKEAGFVSFSYQTTTILDEAMFTEFLDTVPLKLFRIKGPVRFSHKTLMLNFVGGKRQWLDWPDAGDTHLVFIGWNVVKEKTIQKLNACLVVT